MSPPRIVAKMTQANEDQCSAIGDGVPCRGVADHGQGVHRGRVPMGCRSLPARWAIVQLSVVNGQFNAGGRRMALSQQDLLRLLESLCSADGLELVRTVAERMLQELIEAEVRLARILGTGRRPLDP